MMMSGAEQLLISNQCIRMSSVLSPRSYRSNECEQSHSYRQGRPSPSAYEAFPRPVSEQHVTRSL